jgi:hypothetical protein
MEAPEMPSRTAVTTIASIVGVIVAGTAAVSANLGILTAADTTELGQLSAVSTTLDTGTTTSTTVLEPEIIDVYLDDLSTGTALAATPGAVLDAASADDASTFEAFVVDVAGEVTIANYGDRIEVEAVAPAAGWSYSTSVVSATELSVTFEGTGTFVFNAVLLPDGTVAASVDQPIVVVVPAPPTPTAAPAQGTYYDDDDDDGYEDDDRYDDNDYDDEHEGREDDD